MFDGLSTNIGVHNHLSQKKSEANDFGQLLLFCLEGKSGRQTGLLRTSQ